MGTSFPLPSPDIPQIRRSLSACPGKPCQCPQTPVPNWVRWFWKPVRFIPRSGTPRRRNFLLRYREFWIRNRRNHLTLSHFSSAHCFCVWQLWHLSQMQHFAIIHGFPPAAQRRKPAANAAKPVAKQRGINGLTQPVLQWNTVKYAV